MTKRTPATPALIPDLTHKRHPTLAEDTVRTATVDALVGRFAMAGLRVPPIRATLAVLADPAFEGEAWPTRREF